MKSFFVIIAKMENCELENPVVVGQQYQLIVACQVGVENTLQDLEKAGNKVADPNLNEFLVESKENVGQHKNVVVDITLDVVLVNKELENEQGKTKVVYTSNAESILPMDEESRIIKQGDTKPKLVNTDISGPVHSVVISKLQVESNHTDLPHVINNDAVDMVNVIDAVIATSEEQDL